MKRDHICYIGRCLATPVAICSTATALLLTRYRLLDDARLSSGFGEFCGQFNFIKVVTKGKLTETLLKNLTSAAENISKAKKNFESAIVGDIKPALHRINCQASARSTSSRVTHYNISRSRLSKQVAGLSYHLYGSFTDLARPRTPKLSSCYLHCVQSLKAAHSSARSRRKDHLLLRRLARQLAKDFGDTFNLVLVSEHHSCVAMQCSLVACIAGQCV